MKVLEMLLMTVSCLVVLLITYVMGFAVCTSSIADTIYLSFAPVLSNMIVTSQTQVDIEHLKWGYYK